MSELRVKSACHVVGLDGRRFEGVAMLEQHKFVAKVTVWAGVIDVLAPFADLYALWGEDVIVELENGHSIGCRVLSGEHEQILVAGHGDDPGEYTALHIVGLTELTPPNVA